MSQTQGLKILFAYEEKCGVADRGSRCGVGSSVENGQLGDGTAGAVNAQYLLASAGGALENSDLAALDHIESGTGLAFPEDGLARRVVARDGALGKKTQLVVG
jgi:hypothetical protein